MRAIAVAAATAAAAGSRDVRVAVVSGLDCAQCYQIDEVGAGGFLVRAGRDRSRARAAGR